MNDAIGRGTPSPADDATDAAAAGFAVQNGHMRAIRAGVAGGPEVLEWVEVPDPLPGPGELLVRLHAAGVNFIDTYQRGRIYPMPFPHVPGSEGSGVVVSGTDGFSPGDRVAWAQAPGSYAELVVVPAARALRVPDTVELDTAAALPLQGLTAHYLLRSTFPVGEGTTMLITGGAGGVGHLAIQIAKALGATVLATVGTAAKTGPALEAGADHVLVLDRMSDVVADLPAAVRTLVPGGVDVSYDGVGRDTFDATLACIRPRGLQVLFGGASGQVPPFDLQRLNAAGSLFVTRPTLAHHLATREELDWRAGELFGMLDAGTLHVEIGLRAPLSAARAAHEALEARATTGKVILVA